MTIKSVSGLNWTVAAGTTGAYVPNSPNPPAAPAALLAGTAFVAGNLDGIDNDGDGLVDAADMNDEMVFYTLKLRHIDCAG